MSHAFPLILVHVRSLRVDPVRGSEGHVVSQQEILWTEARDFVLLSAPLQTESIQTFVTFVNCANAFHRRKFRSLQKNIDTPKLVWMITRLFLAQVFEYFDLKMCFAPQQRAIFQFFSEDMTPHPPLQRAYFSTLQVQTHESLEKQHISRLS